MSFTFDKDYETFLLDNLNQFKAFYGMHVVPFKLDEQNAYLFKVFAGKNACIELHIQPNEDPHEKPILILESLRFHDFEKQCTVSGSKLLVWVKSFVPDLVSKITLQDESHRTYGDKEFYIPLSLTTKFFLDVGWYESHGFKSNEIFNDKRSKEMFLRLKHTKFNDFCIFLFEIYRVYALQDDQETNKFLNDKTKNIFRLSWLQTTANRNRFFKYIPTFLNYFKYPEDKYNEQVRNFIPGLAIRKPSEKTVEETIFSNYPKNKRQSMIRDFFFKENSQFDEYFITIINILRFLQTLGILYTPRFLEYP